MPLLSHQSLHGGTLPGYLMLCPDKAPTFPGKFRKLLPHDTARVGFLVKKTYLPRGISAHKILRGGDAEEGHQVTGVPIHTNIHTSSVSCPAETVSSSRLPPATLSSFLRTDEYIIWLRGGLGKRKIKHFLFCFSKRREHPQAEKNERRITYVSYGKRSSSRPTLVVDEFVSAGYDIVGPEVCPRPVLRRRAENQCGMKSAGYISPASRCWRP